MVAPAAPRSSVKENNPSSSSSSTNYYVLLAVKICLVVVILLWLAPLVRGDNKNKQRRKLNELKLRNLRSECQNTGACSLLVPEESLNCVNQCLSETCFATIFGANPLEDGEIDLVRGAQFEDCVQGELKALRRQMHA